MKPTGIVRLAKAVLVLIVAVLGAATQRGIASTPFVDVFPICTHTAHQYYPDVDGNVVVWRDKRNPDDDIYASDLANPGDYPLTLGGRDETYPAAGGGIAAWLDRNSLRGVDLSSGRRFTLRDDDVQGGIAPGVEGPIVTWTDERNGPDFDVYAYDFSADREIEVDVGSGRSIYPDTNGQVVVWERDGDIYILDLPTSTVSPICTAPGTQTRPSVHGSIVVWQDDRKGRWDIYGFDLSSQAEFVVSSFMVDQTKPDIDGRYVVWEESADVWAFDLVEGDVFAVTTHASAQYDPRVDGGVVVWQDWRNGNADIYGAFIRALLGDANGDGSVDVLDLAALANHYKLPGPWEWADGDFTGEGDVNVLDLAILANHYGHTTGAGEPIPEPATLALLALGGLALIRRRKSGGGLFR